MTSPTISGQKEAAKTESNPALAQAALQPPEPQPGRIASVFVAWWRVFKLANLLLKPGC